MQDDKTFDATEVIGHSGPIPSERDPGALTHSEPGALGGGVAGERTTPGRLPMEGETLKELERDGGGDRAGR